MVLIQTYKRM